jgi:hypothetical protein
MSGSYDDLFSEIVWDSDNSEIAEAKSVINNSESVNNLYTNFRDYKPYYCGCDPLRDFKNLDLFRRHMKKHHNVVIPNKFKRKAVEVNDDSSLKEKDYKQ